MNRCIAFTLVLSLATAVFNASAQTSGASNETSITSLADSLKGEAKREYEAARVLYQNKDYRGALAKLERAYQLSKDPRLLWNMAACEKHQAHYVRVRALVGQYLQDGGRMLTEQDRKDARELLNAIEAFISQIELKVDQSGATIFIDNENVATTPLTQPLLADVGTREVRVTKRGFADFEKTVKVAGGVPVQLDVSLKRAKAYLRIVTNKEATVWVDGKVVGTGEWQSRVTAGPHEIRVTEHGKEPFATQVDLKPGGNQTFRAMLKENRSPMLWPWIVGGALVIGTGVGGYFLWKKDDDPGSKEIKGELYTVEMPLIRSY